MSVEPRLPDPHSHPPDLPTSATPTSIREVRLRVPTGAAALLFASRAAGVLAILGFVYLQMQVLQLREEIATRSRIQYSIDSLQRETDRFVRSYEIDQAIGAYTPTIDFHASNLQEAGDGFAVGELNLQATAGGAKLTGLIINTGAVGHEGASFDILVGGAYRATFTVMRLPAGGSGRFSGVISDVIADSVRWGQIRYKQSTVSYRRP